MKPSHIEVVFGRTYYVDEFGNYTDLTPSSGGGAGGALSEHSGGFASLAHSTSASMPSYGFGSYTLESVSHYDVSSYQYDYLHFGDYSAGSWRSDTYSITIDKIWSPFGTSVSYDLSESIGWGSWASGTGWNTSSSHFQSYDLHAEHSETPWQVSDFIRSDANASDFWSFQSGNVFESSQQSQHVGQADQYWSGVFGSGQMHDSVLSRLDSFHFQDGFSSTDSQHSLNVEQTSLQWADPYSTGSQHTASYDTHDLVTSSAPGYFSSHEQDVSIHSSDLQISSIIPPFMAGIDHGHADGWLMKG